VLKNPSPKKPVMSVALTKHPATNPQTGSLKN